MKTWHGMRRWLSLGCMALLFTLMIAPAPAQAAEIYSTTIRWSAANQGSLVVGYNLSCSAYHDLYSRELSPNYHDLGYWQFGPLYGYEERYAVVGINSDLTRYGSASFDIFVYCGDIGMPPKFAWYRVDVSASDRTHPVIQLMRSGWTVD
ncbi:hypothetical protein F8S13_26945 [Chloroflexia bacterium SDU3-3]|nr:hypothetical protein F8S13_26945 [Chloroflexia bacterium SDU3-3]